MTKRKFCFMDNNYNPYGNQYGQQGGDGGYLGTPGQGYNQPYGSGGQWGQNGGYTSQPGTYYPQGQPGGSYPQGQSGGSYTGGQQGGYYPQGQPGGSYTGGRQAGYYPGTQPQTQRGYTTPPAQNQYNPYARSGFVRNDRVGFGGGYAVRNLPIIPNAPINYMIFLPLFGLFLENFAPSLPIGILLWGLVIIFLRIAAYTDAKRAVEKNIVQDSAKTVAVLAPAVYLYMRCQGLSRGIGKFIALCVTLIIALFGNGFTQSARMNSRSFIAAAQSVYLSQLNVFDDLDNYQENYILGERVDYYIDNADWNYSEFGGKKCVIIKGTLNDEAPDDYKDAKIEIKLLSNFDGYNIKSLKFTFDECEVDGEELEDDDKEKFVKGLTHDWEWDQTETDDKNEDSSSDSKSDKKE